MSDPIVITRELVKRGWSDFEPKLITGLLSGSVSAFLVSLLGQYNIHLSSLQENFIAVACFFIGGYLTPSTGTAVTKRIDAGIREVQTHGGATVTTVTAPTTLPRNPVGVTAVPQVPEVGIQQVSPGTFTKVIDGTVSPAASTAPANATEILPPAGPTDVLPPYSRGQSVLDAIQRNSQANR